MSRCDRFVASAEEDVPPNVVVNSDFDPDFWMEGARSAWPWRLESHQARFEPEGGTLLGGGCVVLRGPEASIYQSLVAGGPSVMLWDSEYDVDRNLVANNDLNRSVTIFCRTLQPDCASPAASRTEIKIEIRVSGESRDFEGSFASLIDKWPDPEVFPEVPSYGLYQWRYWDEPISDLRFLERVEISTTNNEAEVEIHCVYMPGSNAMRLDPATWPRREFPPPPIGDGKAGAGAPPADAQMPAWAGSFFRKHGEQMLRLENKIDRLAGSLRAVGAPKPKRGSNPERKKKRK